MLINVDCKRIADVEWRAIRNCSFLIQNTVDVWCINIPSHKKFISNYRRLLSADEKKRVGHYRFQNDQDRFIVGRAALRILLGNYLHVLPVDIAFEAGINKKPFVKSILPTIHYNTSHSGDYVLIAFSDSPIGIDAEKIDVVFPYAEIFAYGFTLTEVSYIEASVNPSETFFMLWTRKEALLKATGKGLDDDMPLVPCIDGLHTVENSVLNTSNNWITNSFKLDNAHFGCLASNGADKSFFSF